MTNSKSEDTNIINDKVKNMTNSLIQVLSSNDYGNDDNLQDFKNNFYNNNNYTYPSYNYLNEFINEINKILELDKIKFDVNLDSKDLNFFNINLNNNIIVCKSNNIEYIEVLFNLYINESNYSSINLEDFSNQIDNLYKYFINFRHNYFSCFKNSYEDIIDNLYQLYYGITFQNSINSKESIINVFNVKIDMLILNILFNNKNNNIKESLIYISALSLSPNKNFILSIKLIVLNFIGYFALLKEMHFNLNYANEENKKYQINKMYLFFDSLMNNIIDIILTESTLFSQKFNNLIYDNKFESFKYNDNSTNINKNRVLNIYEYNICKNNLFSLISFVFNILYYNDICSEGVYSFFSKINSTSFNNLQNYYFSKKNDANLKCVFEINTNYNYKEYNEFKSINNTYKFYILMCFTCDVFDFIYSNIHYLDTSFNKQKALSIPIHSTCIFDISSINNIIKPVGYLDFVESIINILYKSIGPNFIELIKLFLYVSEINQDTVLSNENHYSFLKPMNHVGFGTLTYLIVKSTIQNYNKNNFIPIIFEKIHIINIILPISAALLKRKQNQSYFGIDLLCVLFKNNNRNNKILNENIDDNKLDGNKLPNLTKFKYFDICVKDIYTYSVLDVLLDLIDFIGGSEDENKRMIVSDFIINDFLTSFDVLSLELIFNELIIESLNPDEKAPSGGIRDKQISYLLECIKRLFQIQLKENCISIFSKGFLHRIIHKTVNSEIFVLDVIEIISVGLNFLHYLTITDKNKQLNYGFYDKNFIISKLVDIKELNKLIRIWINKSDEDKYKFIQKNYKDENILRTKTLSNISNNHQEQRKEESNSISDYNNIIKNNQSIICLNLINQVEYLFEKVIAEFNNI